MPAGYEWEPLPATNFQTQEEVDQYIVDHAQRGHNLLIDPTFNEVYKEILDEQVLQIVQSKPGQRELREDCYFRIRGLQDLVFKLKGWVNRHEAQVAEQTHGVREP